MDENMVVLTDEDGAEVRFEFLDLIPYQGKDYVVLLPLETDEEGVIILEVVETGGEEDNYIGIQDEKIMYAVFELFKKRFAEN